MVRRLLFLGMLAALLAAPGIRAQTAPGAGDAPPAANPVDPASIQVVAADRVLVIAGERSRPDVSGRYQQLEIEYGPFQRRIPLDEPVDAGAASAQYGRGMLTVTLPIAARPPTVERVTITIRGRM